MSRRPNPPPVVLLLALAAFSVVAVRAQYTIVSAPRLSFGVVGWSYYQTLETSRQEASGLRWTIEPGSDPLPQGLKLLEEGAIRGVPEARGNFAFTLRVSDPRGPSYVRTFSVEILAVDSTSNQPVRVMTSFLPETLIAQENQMRSYDEPLDALGGQPPYKWSLASGKLPAGLGIDPGGFVRGVPTEAGLFTFTARVQDSARPPGTAEREFSIEVLRAEFFDLGIISSSRLNLGVVGAIYPQTYLSARGGTGDYRWAFERGALPAGFDLKPDGQLTGSRLVTPGVFTFTVRVSDARQSWTTKRFSLIVVNARVVTATLPDGAVRIPYDQALTAAGGFPPYVWSVDKGTLPAGLSLDSSGRLTGIPASAGTTSFSVRLKDNTSYWQGGASWTRDYTIRVGPQPPPPPPVTVTTSSPIPSGTVGIAYGPLQLSAQGGVPPYTWPDPSAPSWLRVEERTGIVTGLPVQTGTFTLSVKAKDSVGAVSQSKNLQVTINPCPVAVSEQLQLPAATVGAAYEKTLRATCGEGAYTWRLLSGNPPTWLKLSSAGVLAGMPSAPGTWSFTVEVQAGAQRASASLQLTAVMPDPGPVSVVGMPDIVNPDDQRPIEITLSRPYPALVTGSLELKFSPDPANPACVQDNKSVQLSTGGTSVEWTIAANATRAQFPANLLVHTGTVAGTITLTVAGMKSLGVNIDPDPKPSRSSKVPRLPPSVRTADVRVVSKAATSFEVEVIKGFSTTRDMKSAEFSFTAAPGASLKTSAITVDLEEVFRALYCGPTSADTGGSFHYFQPFSIQGNSNAIGSVSVRLTNSQGSSQAVAVSY